MCVQTSKQAYTVKVHMNGGTYRIIRRKNPRQCSWEISGSNSHALEHNTIQSGPCAPTFLRSTLPSVFCHCRLHCDTQREREREREREHFQSMVMSILSDEITTRQRKYTVQLWNTCIITVAMEMQQWVPFVLISYKCCSQHHTILEMFPWKSNNHLSFVLL